MNKFKKSVAILVIAAQIVGCATLASVLPKIVMAGVEITNVLSTIDGYAQGFFERHPNAEKKAKYEELLAQVRAGLDTAIHATKGVEHLTQSEIDAAFKEFVLAYSQFTQFVTSLGVVSVQRAGRVAVVPGRVTVPAAEDLVPRV